MIKICPELSSVDLDGNLVEVKCLEHKCPKYINIMGADPQTGEMKNQWDCSHAWVPLLLIENSKQQLATSAAIESFRNEMVNNGNSVESAVQILGGTIVSKLNNHQNISKLNNN